MRSRGHNSVELSSCAAAAAAARPDTANAAVTVAVTVPMTLAAQFNRGRTSARTESEPGRPPGPRPRRAARLASVSGGQGRAAGQGLGGFKVILGEPPAWRLLPARQSWGHCGCRSRRLRGPGHPGPGGREFHADLQIVRERLIEPSSTSECSGFPPAVQRV